MSGVAGLPHSGINNLTTLLRRLEATVSRLEDVALTHASAGGFPSGANAVQGAAIPAPSAPNASAAVAPPPPPKEEEKASPAVKGYQELIDGPLATYESLSKELGGLIAEQAEHVAKAFHAQKDFVQLASACTKLPTSSPQYPTVIGPTQSALLAAIDMREKNRASKESNQLTVVAEGLPALGWVTLDEKPGPFVGEHRDSAMFWVNRVIKEYKESNPKQVEWARSFAALLEELRKYIMQCHTTGLVWNPKGADPTTYKSGSSGDSSAGAPPPPPPALLLPHLLPLLPPALNQGEGITKGLKKVDKSEMTHKNPELRGSSAVPSTLGGKAPQKAPKPGSMQKKPPKKELDGNKWNIVRTFSQTSQGTLLTSASQENFENDRAIVVDQTEINQTVNVFNVKSSIIQVKGKVNAISLVNCPKTSILLDSTVSSLSVSNSPSFTVQILGRVPTVLLDGNDGGQVYLSRDSLDCEIVTAKCSAINVSIPEEGEEEGVFVEKPVPEQFKTVVRDGKLHTVVMEHSA
uniref:Adenylyl cyclase-associated protein n=1 Tax=Rhodotorula toruloides TaxID=5286 RepID=A0A0K3CL96_RHOTO